MRPAHETLMTLTKEMLFVVLIHYVVNTPLHGWLPFLQALVLRFMP